MMKVVLAAVVLSIAACVMAENKMPSEFCSVCASGHLSSLSVFGDHFTMKRVKDYARYDFFNETEHRLFTVLFRPDISGRGYAFFQEGDRGCSDKPILRLKKYSNYERKNDYELFYTDRDENPYGEIMFDLSTHKIKQERFKYGYYDLTLYYNLTTVDYSCTFEDEDAETFTMENCYRSAEEPPLDAKTSVQCVPGKQIKVADTTCAYDVTISNFFGSSRSVDANMIVTDDFTYVRFYDEERFHKMVVRCDKKNADGDCFYISREFNVNGIERCYDGLFSRDMEMDDFYPVLNPLLRTSFDECLAEQNIMCPDETPGCKRYKCYDDDYERMQDAAFKDGRLIKYDEFVYSYKEDTVASVEDFAFTFCNGTMMEVPSTVTCVAPLSLPSTLFVAVIVFLFALILM